MADPRADWEASVQADRQVNQPCSHSLLSSSRASDLLQLPPYLPGSDVLSETTLREALHDIRQILLTLPTKADLQTILGDITAAGAGTLEEEEGGQYSDTHRQEPTHLGPPAQPRVPAALISSVPWGVESLPSQILPLLPMLHEYESCDSLTVSDDLACISHSSPPLCNPMAHTGTEISPVPLQCSLQLSQVSHSGEGVGGLPGGLSVIQCGLTGGANQHHALLTLEALPVQISQVMGSAVAACDNISAGSGVAWKHTSLLEATADRFQLPWVSGMMGILRLSGAQGPFLLARLSVYALLAPLRVAYWSWDTPAPRMLKLREAGAIHRWGSLQDKLLVLFSSTPADPLK